MDSTHNAPEEVKDRLPIEQLIGGYVPLKKAGRIYKGLCPFHGEKTPSFTVSPDRGIFKCFGCGRGGDIFDFVMEIEGLTFPEALKLLADRAGVVLPERTGSRQSPPGAQSGKARLFELNAFVADLWNRILLQHPKAEHAREYMKSRGVTEGTLKQFQVGYAPYGQGTATGLAQKQFTRAEVTAAGDPTKFQDRITFPIADLTGKIVGFTGRLLEHANDPKTSDSRGPKYWNTPETPIFIKSKTVYALHLAKHAIQKEGLAILAEGQMDVIALHQAGFTQAVASSGTALTTEQLKLIGRFAPVVAFAYDGDKAGIEATKRGLELALENELTPYVIAMPKGTDPADCLQKDPAIWESAYTNRQPFMEWLLDQETAGMETLTSEQKKQAAITMVGWLARFKNITEQDSWIPFVAARLKTDEQNIRTLLKKLHPNQEVAVARQEKVEQPTVQVGSLGEQAIAILLTFPEALVAIRPQLATLDLLPPSPLLTQLKPVIEQVKTNGDLEQALTTTFSNEERKQLNLQVEELLAPYGDIDLTPSWAVTELSLMLQRIRSEARAQSKQDIATAIAQAQALGNKQRVQELFQELQNLI